MWIDQLSIENAIKEIVYDSKRQNDFCIDPLRFEDLWWKNEVQEIAKIINIRLRTGKYQVEPLLKIDVPKANYTLRPWARPQLFDNIVYHALVNFILSKIKSKVPKENYHFRSYLDSHWWLNHWKEFEDKSRELKWKYKYIISTDIVWFFEHINHGQLKRVLLILWPKDEDYKSWVNFLIDNLLVPWYKDSDIIWFGLPQWTKASSILWDIYLSNFWQKLKEKKIPFFHYVDDIRVLQILNLSVGYISKN